MHYLIGNHGGICQNLGHTLRAIVFRWRGFILGKRGRLFRPIQLVSCVSSGKQ